MTRDAPTLGLVALLLPALAFLVLALVAPLSRSGRPAAWFSILASAVWPPRPGLELASPCTPGHRLDSQPFPGSSSAANARCTWAICAVALGTGASMHVRRETTAAAIVVSVLVCSPCGKAEAQRAPEGVTVAFQTRASAVQYEPILIDLVIVNRLNEPVNFDLGGGWREHLKVDVMRPDGTSIDVPRRVIAGVARRGDITLAAGRMIREQYVLDEWVTLQEPGAYQLKISVQSTFGTASGNVVTPSTTQIMEVHIAPYDEARLRQVCEWLANRAITEPVENPASEDAAVALSHIDHPIAVPYLRRVARQAVSVPEGLIVQALLRIGTVDARDALVEMLQSTDPLVVQNVVDALQRFELRQR